MKLQGEGRLAYVMVGLPSPFCTKLLTSYSSSRVCTRGGSQKREDMIKREDAENWKFSPETVQSIRPKEDYVACMTMEKIIFCKATCFFYKVATRPRVES